MGIRTIFVVGPSSVGKSELAKHAHDALGIDVFDLDAEFKGAERDWPPIERRLLELEKAGTPVLVDMGAGTQDRPELRAFLRQRRDQLVLVWDDWQNAFARNVAAGHRGSGHAAQYLAWEIQGKRDLYDLVPANQRVERAGRDVDAGPADEFVALVSAMLARF